jgi:hypothetical protein
MMQAGHRLCVIQALLPSQTHLDKPHCCCCRRLAILLLHRPCKGGVMQQQSHQRLHPGRLQREEREKGEAGAERRHLLCSAQSTLLLTCMWAGLLLSRCYCAECAC